MQKKNRLEQEITSQIVKFQRELVGRGPEDAKTYIIEDMIVLRLKGVLNTEEKHLSRTEKGRQVVKQIRQVLRETYASEEEELIAKITGCQVISSHSDISTKTGERIEIFILDKNLEQQITGCTGEK
ncbi:MAG: DUF2294 domain-containing protein [Candidatus Saccharibacteria bacterium]